MKTQNRRQFLHKLFLLPAALILPRFLNSINVFSNTYNYKKMSTVKNPTDYIPPYVELHKSGELKARGEMLWERMHDCDLCPRDCYKNRIRGRRGDCKANSNLEVSSAFPHFGEEPELVGRRGSGTIFFTNCSLLCVFCINYDVSQLGQGRRYTINDLADMMLSLQSLGQHNINLVSPTHYAPHILLALDIAASKGLRLPIVYNTSGWEKVEILKYLDNVVDIYLSDFKYMDANAANKYSIGAKTYPELTQKALLEMHRQVGVAVADSDGLMKRGLMIRHLVMPNNVCRTDLVLQWIANNLPKNTYVNLMSQYNPVFKASDYPEISRRITRGEYNNAINEVRKSGLTNVKYQSR